MRTRDQIFTEFLIRNNRTTTDSFITDTTLKNWYSNAHAWGSSFHKWPFTEGRIQTTYTTTEEWNFEGYKADSIRMILVGGARLKKTSFEEYMKFKEDRPTDSDRIFTDYGRTILINTAADVSGTLVAYGQYQPYIDVTDESGTTIFSDWDEEANEAMVEKMTSYLKRREHLADEAELHDQRAAAKLDEVYKRVLDEQFKYQSAPHSAGMFDRISVIRGGSEDDLNNVNQF